MADATEPALTTPRTRRKPQARSQERRRIILDATRQLLETTAISDLSLYQVADKAGVPPSSLYHFFPKVEVLLGALSEEIFSDFDTIMSKPLDSQTIHHWTDITRQLQARIVDYYRAHKYVRDLILGQHVLSTIRHADYLHDHMLGQRIRAHHEQLFQLPPLPDTYNIFAIALQIADKVYAISYQEYGNITAELAREGRRAAQAYLGLYLPEVMAKRQ